MSDSSVVEVCKLLPDKFDQFDETLQKEAVVESGQASPSIPGFAWKMVASEAQQDMHDALHMDVFSVLARGWCLARELHQYTDKAKYPPDQTSILTLGKHPASVDLHPVLALSVGEIRFRPLRFTLTLTADFNTATLLIRNGCIIGVASGDCDVGAQLKYGAIPLHQPLKSRHVTLPGRRLFDAPGLAIG
ncbi:MAG: hypothetical protein JSS21_06415 [Proteobacteria bacterium]|nr:hypothetical protein [Pseudomonadota bacterium]